MFQATKISQITVFVFLLSTLLKRGFARRSPHILFILADDYGWNDIGYQQQIGTSTAHKVLYLSVYNLLH